MAPGGRESRAQCTAETGLRNLPGGFFQEVLVDKRVEVPVEHSLRVPDLEARPLVLDLLVRVEHVVPNGLAPEPDVLNIAALLRQLGLAFLLRQLGEA